MLQRQSVFYTVLLPFFGQHLLADPHQFILFGGLVQGLGDFIEHVDKGVVIPAFKAGVFVRSLVVRRYFCGYFARQFDGYGLQGLYRVVCAQIGHFHIGGIYAQRQAADGRMQSYRVFGNFAGAFRRSILNIDSQVDFQRAESRREVQVEIQRIQIRAQVYAQGRQQSDQEIFCQRYGQTAVSQHQSDICVNDLVGSNIAFRQHRSVGYVARLGAARQRAYQFAYEFVGVFDQHVIQSDGCRLQVQIQVAVYEVDFQNGLILAGQYLQRHLSLFNIREIEAVSGYIDQFFQIEDTADGQSQAFVHQSQRLYQHVQGDIAQQSRQSRSQIYRGVLREYTQFGFQTEGNIRRQTAAGHIIAAVVVGGGKGKRVPIFVGIARAYRQSDVAQLYSEVKAIYAGTYRQSQVTAAVIDAEFGVLYLDRQFGVQQHSQQRRDNILCDVDGDGVCADNRLQRYCQGVGGVCEFSGIIDIQ